jgi:hypothetical protein
MDPRTGELFASVGEAREAGVVDPVELIGKPGDIERISHAVKKLHNKEQKRKARKAAKQARKARR